MSPHCSIALYKELEVRNSFLIMAFTVVKSGSEIRLLRLILFSCNFNHVKLHK